jgi:hypothetical protein
LSETVTAVLSSKLFLPGAVQKQCLVLEFKAGDEFKPEAYFVYVEDLDLPPNAEIEYEVLFLDGHC